MGAGMLGNLNDIDLRMLRTFCAIVEAGGFTAAQARLNTSLSRLSVLVRDLEVRLGYSLCRRGNGGFQLTEEGQELSTTPRSACSATSPVSASRSAASAGAIARRCTWAASMASSASIACRCRWPSGCFASAPRRCCSAAHAASRRTRTRGAGRAPATGGGGAFHHRLSGLYYQPLFREEQNLYCGSAHPFFARADDEPTLGEICAADYVGRGYGGKPPPARPALQPREPTPTPWRPSLPWSSAAPTSATCRRTMPPPGSPKGACGRSGHGNWPTTRIPLHYPPGTRRTTDPDPVPALAVRGAETMGVQAPANTNGIARQL